MRKNKSFVLDIISNCYSAERKIFFTKKQTKLKCFYVDCDKKICCQTCKDKAKCHQGPCLSDSLPEKIEDIKKYLMKSMLKEANK